MRDNADDPWTLFWHGDHPDSCIASESTDGEAVAAFWRDFAAGLPSGARVLDLATGNGAVPRCLLEGNGSLEITAVDKARIDPLRHLRDAGGLRGVDFRGGIDLCALPFDDASFDAVTSQFGVEYAPLEPAAASIARVMRPGALLRLLLHHADSEVVAPNVHKLTEIEALLAADGPLACLHRYLAGQAPLAELESAGRRHLDAGIGSRAISGQIFQGIDRVVSGLGQDRAGARALAASMSERLTAERTRLQQLAAAAMSTGELAGFGRLLAGRGLIVDRSEPLQTGPAGGAAMVGWQIWGRRV